MRRLQQTSSAAGSCSANSSDEWPRSIFNDTISLHGFVDEFATIRNVLSKAVVAVAPYRPDPSSFTQFADPGKLKAYLGAGLPILLTDVPPNAAELVTEAGAEIITFDARQLADRIRSLVEKPTEWSVRHAAATEYAKGYDWNRLFDERLLPLGVS